MSALAGYILSVTAAAVLTAILRVVAGSGAVGKLTNLLSGIFLTVTILAPLGTLELPDPADWFHGFSEDGRAAAEMGADLAKEYSDAIISEKLEAYILDKAAAMGLELEAEVTLDGDGIPVMVELRGVATLREREALSQTVGKSLGIGEEALIWIG